MSLDQIDYDAVRLAIGAAGTFTNARDFETKVASLTPMIAALLQPPRDLDVADTPLATARKVRRCVAGEADSSVFQAEFVKYSEEEMGKTHRLLVAFKSDTTRKADQEGDGLEWMRTEPRWTRAGYVMQRQIRELQAGQPCVLWKHIESIPGNKKVRVLVHLETRGAPRQQSPVEQQQRTPVPQGAAVPDAPGEADPAPAPPGNFDSAIQTRFNKLDTKQQITFVRFCRDQQVEFMTPGPDEIDRVLVWLGKVEKGEALA